MKKLLSELIASSLVLGTFLFLNVQTTYAAANFYLSPSKATVPQGTTLTVSVRVSSAEAIDSVTANLTYPADKFDFISISGSGSAFDFQAPSSGGAGSVSITRASTAGAKSGDKLVALVSFRAKVSSGTALINFAGGTEAVNAGNPVGGGTSGGTYTLAPPPPPPAPPDTTPPKISEVKVTGTSYSGATIEWKTDEASSSTVEYGLTTKYGLSAEGAGGTKDHKVSFASDLVLPGETYHFRVKSADSAGNLAPGADAVFKSLGCVVKIKVVDQKNNPVKGAKVTLASEPQTTTTDSKGIATFKGVAPGKHLVAVDYGGKVQNSTIQVKAATSGEIAAGKVPTQSLDLKISVSDLTKNALTYVLILIVGLALILLGVIAWWLTKRLKGRKGGSGGSIIMDQAKEEDKSENQTPVSGDGPKGSPSLGSSSTGEPVPPKGPKLEVFTTRK